MFDFKKMAEATIAAATASKMTATESVNQARLFAESFVNLVPHTESKEKALALTKVQYDLAEIYASQFDTVINYFTKGLLLATKAKA